MKILKLSFLSLLSGTSLLLISCATMKNGTTQEMHFDSNPQGAIVKAGKKEIGVTPFTTDIKRNYPGIFTFEKEGYQMNAVMVKQKNDSALYLNAAMLPLWPVGHLVDTVSGGRYRFIDDNVTINLEPIDETNMVGDTA